MKRTDRFSIIKLDLDLLVTRSDFEKFRDHHGIPKDKFDIDYFLDERQYSKIWILDSVTFEEICWIDRSCPDQIILLPSFTDEVEKLESYDPKLDMSLDSILDKVSTMGIESLTEAEKNFLDNQSNTI